MNEKIATPKLALSVSEAAAMLGISRPTCYQLIHRQDFPAFKVGGRTLISREGLARWVAQQAGSSSVDQPTGGDL